MGAKAVPSGPLSSAPCSHSRPAGADAIDTFRRPSPLRAKPLLFERPRSRRLHSMKNPLLAIVAPSASLVLLLPEGGVSRHPEPPPPLPAPQRPPPHHRSGPAL